MEVKSESSKKNETKQQKKKNKKQKKKGDIFFSLHFDSYIVLTNNLVYHSETGFKHPL